MKIGDVIKVRYMVGPYTYLVKIESFESDGFRGPYRDITYDPASQTRHDSIKWLWSKIKSFEISTEKVDPSTKQVDLELGSRVTVDIGAGRIYLPSSYTITKKDVKRFLEVMERRDEIPF